MPLSVTVEASENYPDGQAVTLAKLRKGAKPSVAITGTVGGVDLEANSVSNINITSDALIDIGKLAGQTDNNILLVSDEDDSTGGKKLITSAAPQGNAAIEMSGGEAKITPSDDTITGAKFAAKSDTNAVAGLTELTSVATDDYVMVHDTSITAETEIKLKKVTVNRLNTVNTTEYSLSGISLTPSGNDNPVEIDLGGAAFQYFDMNPDKFYNVTIKAGTFPAGGANVRTVTIKIASTGSGTNPAKFGTEANTSNNQKWDSTWSWPERSANLGPQSVPDGKMGLLSITAFGANNSDIVAAWVENQ